MAVQTRAIKRRIKSIRNTRKITKAMELVAASKMRKAVNAVLGTRPYARLAWSTVLAIVTASARGGSAFGGEGKLHLLLRQPEKIKKVLMLVLASDRGLAGGFNANILRKTLAAIALLGPGVEIEAISIGKRAADAMRKAKKPVIASFTEVTNNPKFEEVLPIGRLIINEFTKGTYDKVVLCYTDFVSALSQKPVVLDLLPLTTPEAMKGLGTLGQQNEQRITNNEQQKISEYLFEPSPEDVLGRILPRLMETMVYQAVLESAASEHSARMMAMRSASDAAADMIDALTFTFNQARQAGITQEIAEISSGKAALEKR